MLLVVEPSLTLANLLVRTLRAGGFSGITVEHDYASAVEQLAAADPLAVILGIGPSGPSPAQRFLDAMVDNGHARLPLMILVHDRHQDLVGFLDRRGFGEVLPWQRFSRIPGLLAGLLPEPGAEDEPETAAAPTREVRVLFVDDSQSARHVYPRLLAEQGFAVDVADCLAEARRRLRDIEYDLAVIDYYLPDGTGAQLCAELDAGKGGGPTLAIITGTYRESIIRECLDAGAIECMFKNESRQLFVARVESIARSIEYRKSVEAERERLTGILASVGDGVYGVDSAGIVTFINPTGLSLLGHEDAEAVVGQSASDAIHSNDPASRELEKSIVTCYRSGDRLSGAEVLFATRRGRSIPVECTVFPWSVNARRLGSVVVFRDISERKSADQLRWEATHDTVTGLETRGELLRAIESELSDLERTETHSALLFIDMDRYNSVVQDVGESEADKLLADVASRLRQRLRSGDVLARIDGDRFGLLLRGVQLPNVFTTTESFRTLLSEVTYRGPAGVRSISGSVGVAILSAATPSADYALEHARVACQSAKKKGKNQTHIYVDQDDAQTSREIEEGWGERFKHALRDDRFECLIQPIVALDVVIEAAPQGGHDWLGAARKSGGPIRFELLLRMIASDGERLSPAVFVPLAERIHMASEIDLWVVRRALQLLDELLGSGLNASLSVNLSNNTIQDLVAGERIVEVMATRMDLVPRLVFEVTETAEMANIHSARRNMQAFKKLGCKFALDDFGTGFSSFAHLKNLPVDFIKIDGLFVQHLGKDEIDQTMVRSINQMAHALGLETIAEHVSSRRVLDFVSDCGVNYVQGHYVGEPIDIHQALRQRR